MSVRLRFVLTLTVVVFVILLSSFLTIYTLYAQMREKEFNKRLWAHAYHEYAGHFNIVDPEKTLLSNLGNYLPGALVNYQWALLDSSYHIISTSPGQPINKVDTFLLKAAKKSGESKFVAGSVQGMALYFNKEGHHCFVIATGYDQYGLARLASLRLIMIFVGLGSIIFIGLFALYYVIVATRPLVNLSVQMRRITENNLKQRVDVGKGNIRSNEIVQIANNFNNMLDRLEKAFQLQKNFVHHASHELRTPLATMLAQTESALRRELTPAEAKKVLESLKEDQQEMIGLTNSLLLLSQYENLRYSPEWPPIRMDELIFEAIGTAQKMNPGIAISFNFLNHPENESLLYMPGNENLLRAAVNNLIKNAFKYSDNHQVNITLDTQQSSIVIHFENNGQTIDANSNDHVFLPFFRGQNAMNKRGFGLGLSIVKRIVELHRGTIVYSVVNENTNRFTISFRRLPMNQL